ncbi:phospholipase D-like domain-containing protein [Pseudomonas sp. NPDC090755]|uniref:phospholipase D-like domain-containing protein n=1 Tax=Pseudomonas sp. NPDC090755 TaxID=3364481 RepID=UPI00383BE09F
MKFTENIVPLVKAELAGKSARLKIFSPYLTGSVALEIARLGKTAEVYTLVDTQVLASGASTFEAIDTLLENRIPVYRVPNLHAKMIVAEGVFVTVGSQNLTNGGERRNREVSLRFRGVSKQVNALVRDLERSAIRLTPDFLAAASKAAGKLAGRYNKLREALEKADAALSGVPAERSIEAEVRSVLAKRPQSNPRKCTVVARYDHKQARFQHSLQGDDLLNWPIGAEEHSLKPKYRYLCVSAAGKIGWVRVNKTVYSFIENQVEFDKGGIKGQVSWGVFVDASHEAWKYKQGEANLRAAVFDEQGHELCHVFMRYNTEKLVVYPAVMPRATNNTKAPLADRRNAIEWIDAHARSVGEDIKRLITQPFKFQEKLTGERADKFFGADGSTHYLRLVDLGESCAIRVIDAPV